jgi:hypothetical protein
MKKIMLLCLVIISKSIIAQTTFKMPDEIKFNNMVVQKMEEKKTTTHSNYFTASGDYMAMKPDSKESSLIIYTKDGDMMIVNEKEKSIMVMNLKKFVTNVANAAKDMKDKKSSADSTGAKTNFRKTGKTKTISGYTAEEYEIKRENDLINVWYLKADFSANLLGFFGFGKMENMPNAKRGPATSQFENIPSLGSNYLMAEMEKNGKTILETESVEKTNFTFSSAGYTVRDMTNLMKGNYN